MKTDLTLYTAKTLDMLRRAQVRARLLTLFERDEMTLRYTRSALISVNPAWEAVIGTNVSVPDIQDGFGLWAAEYLLSEARPIDHDAVYKRLQGKRDSTHALIAGHLDSAARAAAAQDARMAKRHSESAMQVAEEVEAYDAVLRDLYRLAYGGHWARVNQPGSAATNPALPFHYAGAETDAELLEGYGGWEAKFHPNPGLLIPITYGEYHTLTAHERPGYDESVQAERAALIDALIARKTTPERPRLTIPAAFLDEVRHIHNTPGLLSRPDEA